MKKKALVTLSAMLLATSAMAEVNCAPFVQEAKVLKDQVVNIDSEMGKVQKKIERIGQKISDRMAEVQSVSSQMQQRSSQLQQIDQQVSALQSQRQQITAELASINQQQNQLVAEIQQAQQDIQMYPSGHPGRRDALRRKKRAEKKLEMLGYTRADAQSRDQAVLAQLSTSSNQRDAINSQLSALSDQRAQIENRVPSLSALQNVVNESQGQLAQMTQVRGGLEQDLLQGEEKVLMCKTYNIKYPKVLSVARKIYKKGCANYEMQYPQNPYKAEAEQEIFNSICFNQ